MKFAITATDRYWGVFDAFIGAGWQPLKLFTVRLKGTQTSQQAVMDGAERHGAAIQMSRMTPHDLEDLQRQGCEALIVAGYDWKVCDWQPYLKYAINFHSSPLPDARGAYPNIRAILEGRETWAVTCHRVTNEIDKGDILAVENFPMQSDETHESLDLKTQMAAKRLASRVADQFVELWDAAKAQQEGSYWKKPALDDSVIDFHGTVDSIKRHVRAFGSHGSMALVGGTWLMFTQAVGWVEPHTRPPGSVAHVFNRSIVVAAADGYIGLLEADLAPPLVVAELQKCLVSKTGRDGA